MVEVVVTLYPRGGRRHPVQLGRGVIINDGSGTETRGNYNVGFGKCRGSVRSIRTGQVKGFPRKSLGTWELLASALKAAGIE